jgi:DNA-binding response OmpR family regulator
MDTILVIDDEKPTLDMFSLFLEAYGFQVHTAENGEQGLALFQEIKPRIVLTDIKMPGMDGIEVLKRIKELDPLAEVIVITGHGDMDLAIEALNLDATDFINKPLKKEDLDAALKRSQERLHLARIKSDEITVRRTDGVAVLDIQGNVTSRTEPLLFSAKEATADAPGVLLKFSSNASINGAGIAIITQFLLDAQAADQATAITGLSDNFKKVFDIVGITKLAEIHDSEDLALESLRT